jgi:pimeloyl-ACP methyl ester carboxylesterase
MFRRISLLAVLLIAVAAGPLAAQPRWQTLPPTPTLPLAARSGLLELNGIKLWYASFGSEQPGQVPVILLHGGLANADYWGNQVPALARRHLVIVLDSRGHGRSSRDTQRYSYGLMASDVVALMDQLAIPRAAIVGWSDGAIIGLDLAIHHPDRVARLFAFAANYTPEGVRSDLAKNANFNAFIARCRGEYAKMSPTPDGYAAFLKAINVMWATEPHFTRDQLRAIHVPVQIVDGDHDEAITRAQTEEMAALIPGAGLLIEPNVSHFAMLQAPGQFNDNLLRFLDSN